MPEPRLSATSVRIPRSTGGSVGPGRYTLRHLLATVAVGFGLGVLAQTLTGSSGSSPPPAPPPPAPPPVKPTPSFSGGKTTTRIHTTTSGDTVFISGCEGSDAVAASVPEESFLVVAPGTISGVEKAEFGGEQKFQEVGGLLEAYSRHGGLRLRVSGEALGGHPLPRGTNVLRVSFRCGRRLTPISTLPAPDSRWMEDAKLAASRAVAGSGDCRRIALSQEGPEFPRSVLRRFRGGNTCNNAEECSPVYAAVQEYADGVGSIPVGIAEAVRCSIAHLAHLQTVHELASFARKHHAVWLVRIRGNVVEWALQGRAEDWATEMQSYSTLQLQLTAIEEAVAVYGLNFDPPLYLLLNTLDEPKQVLTEGGAASPECGVSRLRRNHQAMCVFSADWMDRWTQWGGKHIREPARRVSSRTAYPLLTWSTVPGWFGDLLYPHRHPGSCHHFFRDPEVGGVRWEDKDDRLLFRAFSAVCDPQGTGARQRVVCWAEKMGGLITLAGRRITLDVGGGRGYGPTGSQRYLTPAKQARAKYLLLMDGVVAAFRSTWFLQTGSVIIATGAWVDARTQLLRPWVHYVPVSPDLTDLPLVLSLLAANDTFARWIAGNALAAGAVLSGEPADGGYTFDRTYTAALLRQVHQNCVFNDSQADLIRWTRDRRCGRWKKTRGRIKQCLTDDYACTDWTHQQTSRNATAVLAATRLPDGIPNVDRYFFQGVG
eukprot:Hpha_TRINITY_DN30827_c0_g1::TRINITY_DN30827_c0_g1_i1::g.155718::m.155718